MLMVDNTIEISHVKKKNVLEMATISSRILTMVVLNFNTYLSTALSTRYQNGFFKCSRYIPLLKSVAFLNKYNVLMIAWSLIVLGIATISSRILPIVVIHFTTYFSNIL